jgi:hypothetical protein
MREKKACKNINRTVAAVKVKLTATVRVATTTTIIIKK